jgi:mRNA-degrading endonuclease RelE of RelBE toxin-antitoxin system
MTVEFLAKFLKDLEKLKAPRLKESIVKTIEQLESAENLSEIPNIKKLKGHKSAYRIKLGDYRIGFFLEETTIELARVVHWKDIYKVFP